MKTGTVFENPKVKVYIFDARLGIEKNTMEENHAE